MEEMKKEKQSFVFYRSFYDAINLLPKENKLEVFEAIVRFALGFEEEKLTGTSAAIMALIKPQLEANHKRYQNGKKGGRPKKENQTETKVKPNDNQDLNTKEIKNIEIKEENSEELKTKQKPKQNLNKTNPKPNANVNVNVNVLKEKEKKEKEKENGKQSLPSSASYNKMIAEIIEFLNADTGANFRASGESNRRHIRARLNEGWTMEDFKLVIKTKTAEWLNDPKMKAYLRPETLFSPKFESYINAAKMKSSALHPKAIFKQEDYNENFINRK